MLEEEEKRAAIPLTTDIDAAPELRPPETIAPTTASSIDLKMICPERPPESNQPESPQDKSATNDLNEAGDSHPLPETTATAITAPTKPEIINEAVARLAGMTKMDYEQNRIEQAKILGVRVTALDELVKSARIEKGEVNSLPFPVVEPYPDPIDPAQLLDEIVDTIRRFIILDQVQAVAAALWVALTWFIDVVSTAPLAIINAPEKACAKTLFQTLLARISFRPFPVTHITSSALFRSVELWKPTLFIDEADTFLRENRESQGMINAGYSRSGFVLRSEAVGDSIEPRRFSVYCAKSIAGIALEKHLPDSTMSRGIVFNLRRKLPHESVERLRYADDHIFEVIASKLARFSADYSQQVRFARPKLPDEMSDRAQDNWDPLQAIAECAGSEWAKRATEAALKISGESEQAVSTSNELLADIQQIFENKGITKISTVNLIDELIKDEELPWATYNRGKQISPRQLAKQLSFYGIKSKTVRHGVSTPKGFEYAQFADVFARYLTPPKNLTQQCNVSPEPDNGEERRVSNTGNVAATENSPATQDPLLLHDCGGVSDENPTSKDAPGGDLGSETDTPY